ncbi:MAG TPA: nucleotidyltransferase domain-containing protein [Candidatus Brocadiia bacterium]|nr:nucleotidyltransferase domain-containing protein [Candidatus Brocadiia bacterium]
MDQDTAINAAIYFGQRLARQAVRVSRLILFGSHARGQATADSDVDLLVVSEDFRGRDAFERAQLAGNAERETIRKFQVPLDVILMTPEEFENEGSLLAQAARGGKALMGGAA